MAQYWFDKFHSLSRMGAMIPSASPSANGGFYGTHDYAMGRNFTTGSLPELAASLVVPVPDCILQDVIIKYRITRAVATGAARGPGPLLRYNHKNYIMYYSDASGGAYWFRPDIIINGVKSSTQNIEGISRQVGEWTYWRTRLSATGYSYALWNNGQAIPALSAEVAIPKLANLPAGKLGMHFFSSETDIAWIAVGTDGDEPPADNSVNPVVSGTVYDDAGMPCSREVELYLASTGSMVGSTESDASGNFSISTPWRGQEHVRIIKDDAEGTRYNHLIARVIP